MLIRWLILSASAAVVAGGAVSLWEAGRCAPVEWPGDCVAYQAYQAFVSESGRKPGATDLYGDALVRDPGSPYRWCDLSDALLVAGDEPRAAVCLRRGLALGPDIPAILLRAMNFAVLTGSRQDALSHAARILELVPNYYDGLVFQQLARVRCGTEEIESGMLTGHPGLSRRYLWYLMSAGDVAAAGDVWRWIEAHGLAGAALEREYRAFEAEHKPPAGTPRP